MAAVPWLQASERSFEFWENEEDAVYDGQRSAHATRL